MNWIDIVIIVLLLTSIIIGAKKGMVREISALLIFLAAGITSIATIDRFAAWLSTQMGMSSLISTFFSFMLLLAISYAAFKLAGILFYKIASLKSMGKQDQMGGALVGFVRGWVAVGFLVMLTFLLPMPEKFYTAFEKSFIGPLAAKTVPMIYESTSLIHPKSPSFIDKMQTTILASQGPLDNGKQDAYRVLYQMERFFTLSGDKTTTKT